MNPLTLLLGLLGAASMAKATKGKFKKHAPEKDKDETIIVNTDDDTMTGEDTTTGGHDGHDTMTGEDTTTGGHDGHDTMTGEDTTTGGNDGHDTMTGEDTTTGGHDGHDTMTGEDTTTGGNDGHDTMTGEDTTTGGNDGHDTMTGEDTTTGGNDGHDTMTGEDTTTGGHDGHDTMTGEDTTTGGNDGHDTMTGEDTTTGGHDGHSEPAIAPPGVGASQAEINTYVEALGALGETHVHDASLPIAGEHGAAMNLVSRDDASHVAIGDGDWFDPAIWSNGEVPGEGAKVLIPEGVNVNYSGTSDAELFTVRVDGTLDFATDANSQMIFDTFVVSPSGHLIMGTADNPVDADVDIDLIVANNGPIDTDWDPFLLSRGLLAHGETTIHGAVKDSHEKVTTDPMEGDTSVTFAAAPEGWQVGDTIVIAGTHYDGYKWDHDAQSTQLYPHEDEERVITSIEGNTVHFAEALVFDHDAPRDDLHTSVANYTRNVSLETQNADDAEIYERGHLMFMHSDNVDVRYMELHELGRTDKSITSRDVEDFASTDFDSNVQGRYSLHLHKTGLGDQENPAILEGNAVFGSPGWGIVHHDSNANLTNNATYDTFGSGIVSETGNETGVWSDNIVIYAEGIGWSNPKNTSDLGDNFDTARGGEGFWFQSRLIEASDNVAASVNVGYAFFHRDSDDGRMINLDSSTFDYPDALYGLDSVMPDKAPILSFQGNEVFAANEGLHVVKATTLQGHDVWTHLDDFTGWSVMVGANLEYTAHYLLTDFDLIAKETTEFSEAREGIYLHNNVSEIVISGAQITGFQTGIDLHKEWIEPHPDDAHQYVVIDADVDGNVVGIRNYDPAIDIITTSDQLPNLTPDIDLNPMSYSYGDQSIHISGTKTDSLGTVGFPGGIENMDIPVWQTAEILNNYGYWTTSSGQDYMLLDIYFTDRVTGQVYYETHPVMIAGDVPLGTSMGGGDWLNVPNHGTQDIVTHNGVTMAGDRVLYDPIEAVPGQTHEVGSESSTMAHGSIAEAWMNGYDGDTPLELHIEDQLFVNTGDMSNVNLTADGGDIVLASDGAEFDLAAGTTLTIESDADIGFDGDQGGTTILDMHDGATLAYSAADGDLGNIEEFHSGAFGETPDVQSGVDLGNATLEIDLTGLSADAGSAFSLMSADEIVGVFDDANIGGLGARDANIVIDYINDSVTLQLSAGNGAVTVETQGENSDVSEGSEDLWNTLTADWAPLSETDQAAAQEEEADSMIAA